MADNAPLPMRALSEAIYLSGCLFDGVPILGHVCSCLAAVSSTTPLRR